jgi:hypothetical protein
MRYTLRDPELPHQIVLQMVSGDIGVSCNCLAAVPVEERMADERGNTRKTRTTERGYIAMKSRWAPGEAMQAWEDWHRQGLRSVTIR